MSKPAPKTAAAPEAPPAPAPPVAPAASAASPYAIEDNIPLPIKRIGVKGESTYPFATLGINQSFFVPVTEKSKEPWKTLTSMASRMSRELFPKHFVTARVPATGNTPEGVRIWRTADATAPLPAPKLRGPRKAKAAPAAPDSGNGAAAPATADPFVGAAPVM